MLSLPAAVLNLSFYLMGNESEMLNECQGLVLGISSMWNLICVQSFVRRWSGSGLHAQVVWVLCFLLLLFDCVHTKDFRKHRQTQNNVVYVELSHNRYMKELAMWIQSTIHVMCLVKNSLLGFGSSMALWSVRCWGNWGLRLSTHNWAFQWPALV